MKYYITTILSTLCISLMAQYPTTPILEKNDAIEVLFSADEGYYYMHTIQKGHTIYSLSRAFDLNPRDVLAINNLDANGAVSLGQQIRIPIPVTSIDQGRTKPISDQARPIYYRVKPKETLFRISRMYFDQEVSTMQERNNLVGSNLEINQMLLIGWLVKGHSDRISPENVAEGIHSDTSLMTVSENRIGKIPVGFKKELLYGKPYDQRMRCTSETTVAHWDKTIPDNGTAYALHNTAIPGTYMKMHNPVLRRSVNAKVIGKIPFGTYTSDVKLVISPRAAKSLGGLDKRFRVRIDYIK